MKERTAKIVNDCVNLKWQNIATFTERLIQLESQINNYDESLLKLQLELSETTAPRKVGDLRQRIGVLRELQHLAILEVKGIKNVRI